MNYPYMQQEYHFFFIVTKNDRISEAAAAQRGGEVDLEDTKTCLK